MWETFDRGLSTDRLSSVDKMLRIICKEEQFNWFVLAHISLANDNELNLFFAKLVCSS